MLRLAHEHDFELIAKLANRIWNKHYISIITQQQIDYMLEKMYNYDSLLKQQSEGQQYYLINDNQGFIAITDMEEQLGFINKLYIDLPFANQGLGTQVLQQLDHFAFTKYQLTVNRKNYKSINFYFKNGFYIKEVKDFDIGQGFLMEDFIMEKIK